MKVWRLVAGILSIIFFVIVEFQSCAVGFVNAVEENGGASGSVGLLVGILLLTGGIVSIVTRNAKKGGHIAVMVIFGLAAVIGFTGYGNYSDLIIWSIWALVNAGLGLLGLIKSR